MRVSGIIVEYNPFHNGHKYHIDKCRQLTNPDVLVAVCSGNYNQRGDISIYDKFDKCLAALNNGVDLVIELPYICTLQNAYVFASSAIKLLEMIHTNYLVFGSETNNLEELKKMAQLEVDVTRLKTLMHDGVSYPSAYGLLSSALYPNDILAVAYLKALQNSSIEPISIQRTNQYHDQSMQVIASSSAIRKAIKEGKDYSQATNENIPEPLFFDDLYPYIRYKLLTSTSEELSQIFLVSEGIENMLKKNAIKYDNYQDFIKNSISRRYTASRIQRICCHILNNIKKSDVANLSEVNYLRVLGFNNKGQKLLRELKSENMNIITQFKNIPADYKEIEWRSSLVYSQLKKDPQSYVLKELKGPIVFNY